MKYLRIILIVIVVYLTSFLISTTIKLDSDFVLQESTQTPNWFTLPTVMMVIAAAVFTIGYLVFKFEVKEKD